MGFVLGGDHLWALCRLFSCISVKCCLGFRRMRKLSVESMMLTNLAGIYGKKQERYMILEGKFFMIAVLLNACSSLF